MIEVLVIVGAFAAGWAVRPRLTPNYKKRWQESLRLMETLRENGEIEKRVVIEKKIVKELESSEADELLRKNLRSRGGYYREELEKERLKNGLHPIDDLKGLGAYQYGEMVKRRMKYGYDELGRKFK